MMAKIRIAIILLAPFGWRQQNFRDRRWQNFRNHHLQKKLRAAFATPRGRAAQRDRVMIEHRLSHHARKQGPRARYLRIRNNVFDSRRYAATLEVLEEGRAARNGPALDGRDGFRDDCATCTEQIQRISRSWRESQALVSSSPAGPSPTGGCGRDSEEGA
jgi:hypothetical protein